MISAEMKDYRIETDLVGDAAVKKGILTEQEADSLLNPLPLTDWSGNGED